MCLVCLFGFCFVLFFAKQQFHLDSFQDTQIRDSVYIVSDTNMPRQFLIRVTSS